MAGAEQIEDSQNTEDSSVAEGYPGATGAQVELPQGRAINLK